MIERTLVLIKPDGVERGLVGKIISRFEDAGLKIVGMKMVWVDEDLSKKHYFDVAQRRGERVLQNLFKYMNEGPVITMVIEGLHAVEVVRKIVGPTEPLKASPGTIRGDYAHHSFAYTDSVDIAVKNLIHASGNIEEAKKEVKLWFKDKELHTYKTVHEKHVF